MLPLADERSGEVCQMETFHAACSTSQVIVMESAQLGRLKIGISISILLATSTMCSIRLQICFSARRSKAEHCWRLERNRPDAFPVV